MILKHSIDIMNESLLYLDNKELEDLFYKLNSLKTFKLSQTFIDIMENHIKKNNRFYPSKEFIQWTIKNDYIEVYDICKKYKRIPKSLCTLEEFCEKFNYIFHNYNDLNEFPINYSKKKNTYTIPYYFSIFDVYNIIKDLKIFFIIDNDIYLNNITSDFINKVYLDKELLENINWLYENDELYNIDRFILYNFSYPKINYNMNDMNDVNDVNEEINNNKKYYRAFDNSFDYHYNYYKNKYWINLIIELSKKYKLKGQQDPNMYSLFVLQLLDNVIFNSTSPHYSINIFTQNESIINMKIPFVLDLHKYYYWGDFGEYHRYIQKFRKLIYYLKNDYLDNGIDNIKRYFYINLLSNYLYLLTNNI